jgi:uncharacterized short protein YbdD (DUF466 family)
MTLNTLEMFDILSHKGTTKQNVIEIPSYSSYIGHHKENKQQMLVMTR